MLSCARKDRVKEGQEGKENNAFHLDDNSKEPEKTFQANMRGFLVILALSLHAVFEGIAVGLSHSPTAVWYLFFAIAAHKYVISFCCGVQFVTSGVRRVLVIAYIAVFSLISPVIINNTGKVSH